jgi:hypothetical protein
MREGETEGGMVEETQGRRTLSARGGGEERRGERDKRREGEGGREGGRERQSGSQAEALAIRDGADGGGRAERRGVGRDAREEAGGGRRQRVREGGGGGGERERERKRERECVCVCVSGSPTEALAAREGQRQSERALSEMPDNTQGRRHFKTEKSCQWGLSEMPEISHAFLMHF